MRRAAAVAGGLYATALLAPPAASAHGILQRADLPIPEWLFGWAAAMVLLVSFVALASLWPQPVLQEDSWRPFGGALGRLLASPTTERTLGAGAAYAAGAFALEVVTRGEPGPGLLVVAPFAVAFGMYVPRPLEKACGAFGVFVLGMVVWSGFRGAPTTSANFAPTFVYVIFWLAPVPLSILFGDVFRAFNPWRAIGRFVGWTAQTAAGGEVPPPLAYPPWLGRFPACAGLVCFTTMELVVSDGSLPRNLAIATLVYTVLTFVAMALVGVEQWSRKGEAFSVYFNLFSRLSAFEIRAGVPGVRRPLSGAARLDVLPGTILLLSVMIGSVTFDGAAEAPVWTSTAPHIANFFKSIGCSPQAALEYAYGVGLLLCIGIVYGFYRAGIAGARSIGGELSGERLAATFIHSLVPIALAYVAAHYFTLLLFQGQAIVFLSSDPLGNGANIFGTASSTIDYTVIGQTATWYYQVAFVVIGHVLALTLAHDRALAIYDQAKLAVRSQYWMLVVMVGFTSLALYLLSQANQ